METKKKKQFTANQGEKLAPIHAKITQECRSKLEELATHLGSNITQVLQMAITEMHARVIGDNSN